MESSRTSAIAFLFIGVCVTCSWELILQDTIPEDGRLNFTALAEKYGHRAEEYDIVTEDGYILKLFHIFGDRCRPVLLMHGIIDSADTFIIRGKGSLAIALADRSYDVWAGNTRGSRYSRRHVTLDPDTDKKFWDFSYHESGTHDLPALIDSVLNKTGQPSLSAIGHSQGNTIFYVLGSTKPEYNEKINVLIALSPVCFLINVKPAIKTLVAMSPIIDSVLGVLGEEEIFSDKSIIRNLVEGICPQKVLGYTICAYGIFFIIGGSDPDEMEPEFFAVVVGHYPTGTSRKNILHLSQNAMTKSFAQFDNGTVKNESLYNSEEHPRKYDLSRVKMKVAMLFGENDGISSLEDVNLLRTSLPNVVEFRLIDHKSFNHLDAVWGRNMKVYLFPHVFEILEKYSPINSGPVIKNGVIDIVGITVFNVVWRVSVFFNFFVLYCYYVPF